MKAIRAGLDRYLNKENTNFSIITDRDFKPANEALNAHLVELAREGKISSTKHKPALIPQDVEILYEKKQLGLETPESLFQTAWFNIMLHFGKRGRENMREMTAEDIQIHKSSSGLESTSHLLKGPRRITKEASTAAKMRLQLSCQRCREILVVLW